MSDGVSPRQNFRLWLGLVLGGGVVLVLIALYALRTPPGQKKNDSSNQQQRVENHLAQVRNLLARNTDLPTCRTVVQLLNAHAEAAQEEPPALAEAASVRLRSQFGLDTAEMTEIQSRTFTPLDAHYLDSCFLFRDAARSLEIQPLSGMDRKIARQSPLDRAVAGFDWVVRQVRLGDLQAKEDSELAPPAAVLRRGVGSALQRSLVFLALLEQFGLEEDDAAQLHGCLIHDSDGKGNSRLWACGVAIGKQPKELFLFDPRVGLPIPGPGGKGVATLSQVRLDPAVLAQWKIDKVVYDVSQEQAKHSSALVVVPLTALAPRMLFLQERLLRERKWKDQPLPAQVRLRLAEDPGVVRTIVAAALGKPAGKGDEIEFWREGTGLLRRFLPVAEGGSDRPVPGSLQRSIAFQFNAIPRADYPKILRQDEFGPDLSTQLFLSYASPFLRAMTDPNSPRELLLRGRFSRALPDLVSEQGLMQGMRERLHQAGDLNPEVRRWLLDVARPAYADLSRAGGKASEAAAAARVAQLWQWKVGEPIEVLVRGSAAGPRGAEVSYQLALCKHEQAVRSQLRIDLAATIGLTLPSEANYAEQAWLDAEGHWKEFLDANPKSPAFGSAQRLRGEALAARGLKAEARKLWTDTSARQSELERLARLWLAHQRGSP